MRRFLAYCWLALCCGPALAAGEHERRLAAELMVLAGDVRRVTATTLPPLERAGLERRIVGSLSSLPLLLRRTGRSRDDVSALRIAADRKNWPALLKGVEALKRRVPFIAERLLGSPASEETLARGAALHRSTCAACHDTPAPDDTFLPAKNLTEQMKSMPREEFAARLWLGVRGDRITGYANPFSDSELAALIVHYGQTP